MINVDDRLLENVDQAELFLLCHIVKRLNRGMFCFPANKTLLKDTGWAMEKLQKVKKSLVEKEYLTIEHRFSSSDRQTTNIYKVKTSLIGAYVGGDRLSTPPVNPTPTPGKTDNTDSPENQATEVLTREEVLSSETNVSDAFTDIASEDGGKKEKGKKKEKPADPCYRLFVKAWTEAYPVLGFSAVAGAKIKAMIKSTRDIHRLRHPDTVPGDGEISGMFEYVLAYVKRTNHWIHGKDITTFEGKYRSVIEEIRNGKRTGQNKPSTREIIDSL